jgi:hypothetical protein
MDNQIKVAAHKALDLALAEYEKRGLSFDLFDVAVLEYRCDEGPTINKEMLTKVGVELIRDSQGCYTVEEVYAHTKYYHDGLEVPK